MCILWTTMILRSQEDSSLLAFSSMLLRSGRTVSQSRMRLVIACFAAIAGRCPTALALPCQRYQYLPRPMDQACHIQFDMPVGCQVRLQHDTDNSKCSVGRRSGSIVDALNLRWVFLQPKVGLQCDKNTSLVSSVFVHDFSRTRRTSLMFLPNLWSKVM